MKWFITGDTHGHNVERIKSTGANPGDAVIILGDVGLNFYLNKTDYKNKKALNNLGIYIYCVRGNHEERPEKVGAHPFYDSIVKNEVYIENDFPFIRYFIDGNTYNINEYSVLVIGGAYSVDKYYRLSHFAPDASWTGWFKDEQLTEEERMNILNKVKGKHFDLILTHTCPIDWEPTDLFLSGLNQDSVDNSTELWMQELKENIDFGVWLFGHFHSDRLVRPHVEMYYTDSESLENIIWRWKEYDKDEHRLDWWLVKDPMFYADEKGVT